MRHAFSILLLFLALGASALGVGQWRVYGSYSDLRQVEPAGDVVYALAAGRGYAGAPRMQGHLYSYRPADGTVRTYDITGVLHGRDVLHIVYARQARRLVIVYNDGLVDLLSASGDDAVPVSTLRDFNTSKSKGVVRTATDGRYVYLDTELACLRLDAKSGVLERGAPAAGMQWTERQSYTYDATRHLYWGADDRGRLTPYNEAREAQGSGVAPDAPEYAEHYSLLYNGGRLYSTRGQFDTGGGDSETPADVQCLDVVADTWTTFVNDPQVLGDKRNIAGLYVAVDPRDRDHVMLAAKSGLYEYRSGRLVAYHDCTTDDPIQSVHDETHSLASRRNYSVVRAMAYDRSGNLWLVNMRQQAILCLTAAGEWKTFPHPEIPADDAKLRYSRFTFDSNGFLWFVNDFYSTSSFGFYDIKSDQLRLVTDVTNEDGTHVSETLRCIAEDHDRNIWAGQTYVTPSDINYMCRNTDLSALQVTQHKISRNDGTGLADYLLSGVDVYDMKVDAAGRKWFATTSGVYLISADNNVEEAHFTAANSPLPSDEVKSLALDEATGMVWFGTLAGLAAYQSDVRGDYAEMSDASVYAYPNPVPPDYYGAVTIVGLTPGAQVKIVNAAGAVVNTGAAHGSTYQWDATDATGQRVASGVYMVLVSTADGEDGCVTKVAVVR